MFSLREKLIKEFIDIFNHSNFDEIKYLLSLGDYTLELSYSTGITQYDGQDWDEIPFGYIYNKTFFEERFKYIETRSMVEIKSILSSKEIATDIANISKKMEVLHGLGLFDKAEKILDSWKTEFDSQNIIKYDEQLTASPYINLKVKTIKVLGLDYMDHDDIDMGVTSIEEIMSKLPLSNTLVPIPYEPWFEKLSSESKLLIRAGNKLLERIKIEENKEDIIDYSPLLLDFIKGLEEEIITHFDIHRENIINIATIIKDHYKGEQIEDQRIQYLKKTIIGNIFKSENENYRPNGLAPLYYFLKYFALKEDLPSEIPFHSYLSDLKFEYLKRQKNVIERLERLKWDRDTYIHQKLIESEDEFKMIYNDISFALKILAELK